MLELTPAGDWDVETVTASVRSVLLSTRLLAMATVTSEGTPWINNAYFSFDQAFTLYFLTQDYTMHSRNLPNTQNVVAVAITDSQQTGDEGKRGLQLIGECSLVTADALPAALQNYRTRFPHLADILRDVDSLLASGIQARPYAVKIKTFKLFDEVTFGPESWIEGTFSNA